MIRSMTGYGSATRDFGPGRCTVEIKSLNSKFLELSLKLPKALSDKEFFLRNECSRRIERGKVNISIGLEYTDASASAALIDTGLLQSYYRRLKTAADELGDSGEGIFQAALSMPDVVQYESDTTGEEEWKTIRTAFEEALQGFQKFREDEGAVLKEDLGLRIKNILSAMRQVEQYEPARTEAIREKLDVMLAEAVGREHIDQNRLEHELIFYIEKLDITEEKVRLQSHCDYFLEAMQDDESGGKKLGFISQEIGREINTMGSKANDARIQQLVVEMKEELEKIKEQLLNVL